MAKARKAKKSKTKKSKSKKAKRSSKSKARAKPAKKRAKSRRTAKPKPGPIDTVVGAAEDAAALRSRLAGSNTFED